MAKKSRPKVLTGITYEMETGCGSLYVTINGDKTGLIELFPIIGKGGGCAASQCEAIGRMVSLAWKCGATPEQTIKQLIGITCHSPRGIDDGKISSCSDGIAKAIKEYLEDTKNEKEV
jgi:ribonucleoside-diphosphate reductase alpha chain